MTDLLDHLQRRIRLQGALSVSDFMAEALGNPKHGYYMTRDPLGAAGDFTTAPEISQMFGEMIGLWLADCWGQLDQPEKVVLIECGPGRGTLMADILRAARMAPGFADALSVHLVETSPTLRKAQEKALSGHAVTWHDTFETVPDDGVPFIVANEFFDALPVSQVQLTDQGWRERMVGLDADDNLALGLATAETPLAGLLSDTVKAQAKPDDVAELCPIGLGIARSMGARIQSRNGVGIFIDYGYGQSACGETLQAVRDHEYAPVLDVPGEADLTTHVDFEALAKAFAEAGAAPQPLLTQRQFLEHLGIKLRAEMLKKSANPDQAEAIDSALHRLTAKDQMGDLFKVLVVTRG